MAATVIWCNWCPRNWDCDDGTGNIGECGIEVESFAYKGFPDAENLVDLVDRIATYMAENRNTKLKVIRHNPRRHIGCWYYQCTVSDAYGSSLGCFRNAIRLLRFRMIMKSAVIMISLGYRSQAFVRHRTNAQTFDEYVWATCGAVGLCGNSIQADKPCVNVGSPGAAGKLCLSGIQYQYAPFDGVLIASCVENDAETSISILPSLCLECILHRQNIMMQQNVPCSTLTTLW
jgi:hypothetical protein